MSENDTVDIYVSPQILKALMPEMSYLQAMQCPRPVRPASCIPSRNILFFIYKHAQNKFCIKMHSCFQQCH
jgi:hypothetical protein